MNFLRKAPPMPNTEMALCVVEGGPERARHLRLSIAAIRMCRPTRSCRVIRAIFNLPDPPLPKPGAKSSGRRTGGWRNWIASKGQSDDRAARHGQSPLQHHFGRGIVRTTE